MAMQFPQIDLPQSVYADAGAFQFDGAEEVFGSDYFASGYALVVRQGGHWAPGQMRAWVSGGWVPVTPELV